MPRRRELKKCKNGWGLTNGKVGDGTHQASSKYLSNTKGGLPRTGKSFGSTICHVEYKRLEAEFSSAECKRRGC